MKVRQKQNPRRYLKANKEKMTTWLLTPAHNIIYVLFTNIIKIGFTYDGPKKVCLCL